MAVTVVQAMPAGTVVLAATVARMATAVTAVRAEMGWQEPTVLQAATVAMAVLLAMVARVAWVETSPAMEAPAVQVVWVDQVVQVELA